MTLPLSTPPPGQPIGPDSFDARQKITTAIGNLNSAVAQLQTLVGATDSNTTAITNIEALLQSGFSGTIVTAKLSNAGTEGSMTFTHGVLTAQTPAT